MAQSVSEHEAAAEASLTHSDDAAQQGEKAREIALRLLSHAPRSTGQLREALVSREIPEDVADEVVARYVEVGLLDDAALAGAIARTRHRERGKARRVIAQELQRKGFDAAQVDEAVGQISEDDERDAAAHLAEKRWRQLSNVDEDARVRRVVGMLGRRGYSPSLAFALVKDLQRADIEDA
ncbi:regulatory protein RecX [Demequina flava]|uniref:regulatory protein RecX n=1 Tax=Demequina flava TaxID=1095025 RepID=UPI000784B9E1|nr:regulatory protein RecX [Demequina flava]